MRRLGLMASAVALLAAVPGQARPLTAAEQGQLQAAQNSVSAAMSKQDWPAAATALREILRIDKAALGPDHPDTLDVLFTLGLAEQFSGRNAEALAILREAEALWKQRGQTETAPVAGIVAGIGVNLDRLGKYAEAEVQLRRALAMRLKINGEGSLEASFARSELAQTLSRQGKYAPARDMLAEVLEATRKREGPYGKSVGSAIGNLASLESNLGNFDKAESLYTEGLALHRKNFGAQSRQVAIATGNIAYVKTQRGDYLGAEPLYRESVATLRAIKADPTEIATAIQNLAATIQNGGKPAAAIPLFKESIALLTARWGEDHPATIRAESNYATALVELGQAGEAEIVQQRVLAIRNKSLGPTHPDTITSISNLAATLEKLGREQEAEALYRQAIAAGRSFGGDANQLATTISGLATNLGAQGRYGEAVLLHNEALAMRKRLLGPEHPDVALTLGNLGYVLTLQRKPEDADKALTMAVAISRKTSPGSLGLASHLNNWAANLEDLGRHAEAEKAYREALALRLKALGPKHPLVANIYNNLGYTALSLGRNKEAEASYRQALATMRAGNLANGTDMIVPLNNLGILLAERKSGQAEALKLGREAAQIARKRRALIASGGTGSASQRAAARARGDDALGADPYYTAFAAIAEINWLVTSSGGQNADALRDEAFLATQDIELSKAAQAMARTAARAASGGGALGTLVARQQKLTESLGIADANYLKATAEGDGAAATRFEAETAKIGAELATLDEQIDAQFPDYRTLIAPTALAADDVKQRLQKDEGLLFIVPLNGSMYSYAIGPGGARWNRLEKAQKSVAEKVARLLCQVDPVTCESDDKHTPSEAEREGYKPYDRAMAFGLYDGLVKPVEPALAGAKRVYVVTIGKLSGLPLGLLPTVAPAAGSDNADPDLLAATPWLADRYAMITLPSVSSLRFAGQQRAAATRSFAGYGAPRLTGGSGAARALRGSEGGVYRFSGASGDLANPAILKQLSPLPGTERELKAMAESLGAGNAALRLAAAATEKAFKKDAALRDTRVIAIATHGLLPGELNGYEEPGLVFTPPAKAGPEDDGVLSASEAAALSLNADWVILSACNTASSDNGGAGLSGLARAFLYAGAKSLLASHWRVSDTATAALTVEALNADKTMTRGEALQAAMKAVRTGKRADGSPLPGWQADWAHPSAWAPFTLISNSDR